MRYRVYCDFAMEADSPEEILEFLLAGNHIVASKTNVAIGRDDLTMEASPCHETNEVYADIRRRFK